MAKAARRIWTDEYGGKKVYPAYGLGSDDGFTVVMEVCKDGSEVWADVWDSGGRFYVPVRPPREYVGQIFDADVLAAQWNANLDAITAQWDAILDSDDAASTERESPEQEERAGRDKPAPTRIGRVLRWLGIL